MKKQYYRFVVGDQGIYEVVYQLDPKRNNPKRENKPNGGWLPRVGEAYSGAISFWTEKGLRKYRDSGLMRWHIDFIGKPVEVLIGVNPENILYQDKLQIICKEDDIQIVDKVDANDLSE